LATVCKTVRPILLDRRLSVMSCPVCDIGVGYRGQRVGWIKVKLGTQLGLSPGHIVLDGNPAPPPQGAQFSCAGACWRLEGVLFTVSRLPPEACWRLQAAPSDYSRQMLWLAATTASWIFQRAARIIFYFI